ncbi:helix-turn-helix transcriptional regulator [Kitasatospora viridis]|uniref:LuxR family two component transcriptional regulator n=1 Tax=Kitasatospora viridis TaxID=281105 RepID=A0A561T650_9ACTN|nr:helix-turn-helix transcriptional regulator [Kitasatospora viridis]TWF82583.1 LuxR family two component transcriptional regulator [Kitasatospora viridis]
MSEGARAVPGHTGDGPVLIGVVDECQATALGVASWLDDLPGARVVVAPPEQVAEPYGRVGALADVLVMELVYRGRARLPDIGRLAHAGREVVVYTRSVDRPTAAAVTGAGALCCVSTTDGREALVPVLAALLAARGDRGPRAAGAEPEPEPEEREEPEPEPEPELEERPSLSAREIDTTVLWLRSPSKHVVARQLRISPHTVDMYLRRVRHKYEQAGRPAHTKAELLTRAIEDGLITVGCAPD